MKTEKRDPGIKKKRKAKPKTASEKWLLAQAAELIRAFDEDLLTTLKLNRKGKIVPRDLPKI